MTLRFRSHVSLSADARTAIVDALNATLAATLDLSSQVKQAHWNVRGENFFASHQMFDLFHGHVVGWSDEIAERVAQLGGQAEGTVRVAAARSPLKEHDAAAILWTDHVRSLTGRYAALGALVRGRIDAGPTVTDPVTVDLYTQVLRSLERDLWMLESHLEKSLGREPEQGLAPPLHPDHDQAFVERDTEIIHG